MKLWHSTTSPYVRKVMAVIFHHQLANIDLCTITSSFDPNSPHNQANPLGRVPALELDNGDYLYNSLLICEYLDQLGTINPRLIPQDERRWQILQLHALADGILENTVPMIAEKMLRPENEWWTARHQQLQARNQRSFIELEKAVKGFGFELNIGTIMAVCLVDWWQFRENLLNQSLETLAPNLVKWAAEMNKTYPALANFKPKQAV